MHTVHFTQRIRGIEGPAEGKSFNSASGLHVGNMNKQQV